MAGTEGHVEGHVGGHVGGLVIDRQQVRTRRRPVWLTGTAMAVALLAVAATPGCSSDIFDVNVVLTAKEFPLDFGTASGMIPSVACDPQQPTFCGNSQVIALQGGSSEAQGQVALNIGCDSATKLCYAQADANATYTVDVLQDESFTSKVGRRAVTVVRMMDIAYSIAVNTTTFDIPSIDVSVGPPGTAAAGDFGAFPVDRIAALPKGTVVAATEPRHFTLADDSPARDLIERSILAKSPFVFVMTTTPRMGSGAPMPAGKVQIAIRPVLGLGLR